MGKTCMQSLTLLIFIVSEKIATLKCLPQTNNRPAGVSLIHIFHVSQKACNTVISSKPYRVKLWTISLLKQKACLGAYLYSAGSQHGNLHQSSVTRRRVTYFILWAHQEHALVTTNEKKKSRKRFEKWRWMNQDGRYLEFRKKFPAVGEAHMAWPTPGFKGRTFELWVLNRGF